MDYKKYNNKPYLLVDSSYVSFYRFFSTLIWYTNTFPNDEITDQCDWSKNAIFIDRYDKLYMSSIDKIRYKYDIPYENVIIVRDCPREHIWRMDIYPEYKATRKNTCSFKNKRFNIGSIFKHIYSKLYPQIESKYKLQIVKFDNAEADDVIAILSKKIHEIDTNRLIVIITNDNDYLQLVNEKILIWSLQNKLLNIKVDINSKDLLLKKILKGDDSDNIPTCLENNDDEYISNLLGDKAKLNNLLNTNELFKNKFELNRRLIDFNYIPDNIQNNVIDHFSDYFPKKVINPNMLFSTN